MLGITLSDGTFIIPTVNPIYPGAVINSSTPGNPIELPNLADTFADVKTLVPTGQSSIALTSLLGTPYNYWGDDDGDNTPTATGTLALTITDASGNVVTNTASLNACNSPYTLKLTSTLGSLRTQFGAPHSSTFNSSTATYYVRPKMGAPMTCFAKPNIIYQSESSGQVSFDPAHWERSKGFKMQDINNPAANFPRTGFNGAYFDLTVGGTSAESIIAANGSTVDAKSGASNIKLILTAQGLNIVRVRLLGPSSGAKAGEPGPAPVTMPTEFILYSDAAKVNKLYSFL